MATLEGFLDELILEVRQASGINFVPDDPPASIANTPAAVIWLADGRASIGPDTVVTYHHRVRIGLLTGIQNIAIANQKILPKIETVIEAVLSKLASSSDGFDNCQNIEATSYTYGPIEWADIWYFGALIDLEDVKIQRTI